MAGLSDKVQGLLMGFSAGMIGIGTAAEAIPSNIDPAVKSTLFVVFWVIGVVGIALKDAVGNNSAVKAKAA